MKATYTKQQVQEYINSKQMAWSLTTQKSELSRLTGALDLLNQGAPSTYNLGKTKYKLYALKTLFIRAADFANWATGNANNEFALFLRNNRLLFKGAYKRSLVGMSFNEAASRVANISNPGVRQLASFILRSGLRASEALAYDNSGHIKGKGSKDRPVFCAKDGANLHITYGELYRELKRVGLKPHDLRKLAASQLAAAGFKEADLLKVMGWSSIETAAVYLQPRNDNELSQAVQAALNVK